MQVLRDGDALFVGHFGTSGMGTSILDVTDRTAPKLMRQWPAPPNTHTHKVQVADGLLLVNHEVFPYGSDPPPGDRSAGLAVYRLDDPFAPALAGFWESTGRGVHRIVWTGGRQAGGGRALVVAGPAARRRRAPDLAGGPADRGPPRAAGRPARLSRLRRRQPGGAGRLRPGPAEAGEQPALGRRRHPHLPAAAGPAPGRGHRRAAPRRP